MRRIHQDDEPHVGFMLDLDGIAREGARRMLAEALEAEVEAYVQAARDERDERGHALVVRNGYANEREILLGPDRSRSRLRGSTTSAWTQTATAGGFRA